MTVIQISRVVCRFGDRQALRGVSVEAPDGAVTGFVGPNGAGKSTLLRIVAGLDQPDEGVVAIDGKPVGYGAPRKHLGVLLDANWVYPRRTAADHLKALALMQGVAVSRVDEVLEFTGLREAAKRRVGQFSLGMKQRLGIAAALLNRPGNVILDEPVNGLDPDGVIWVRHLVKALAADGAAVLMSSHLLAEMAQTADRVVVIGRGQTITQGAMSDLMHSAASSCLVATMNVAALSEACRSAGVTMEPAGDGLLRVPVAPRGRYSFGVFFGETPTVAWRVSAAS